MLKLKIAIYSSSIIKNLKYKVNPYRYVDRFVKLSLDDSKHKIFNIYKTIFNFAFND